ncbi:hypothetical protein FRC06_000926 [Ceratobasidium sp. 370]|nr:hypothetical protein FRC06_000926 [Ceratobasidium sp. 370]
MPPHAAATTSNRTKKLVSAKTTTEGQRAGSNNVIVPNERGGLSRDRYEQFDQLGEITATIKRDARVVFSTPDGRPNKLYWLCNLGSILRHRFDQLGELSDLNRAIDYFYRAVLLLPEAHPMMMALLNTLGDSYRHRFEYQERVEDIEKAIKYLNQAVSFAPEGHPARPSLLNSLGASYNSRFIPTRNKDDLEKAVGYLLQASSLSSGSSPANLVALCNLAVSHGRRFENFGEMADLDKGIEYLRQAVSHTPNGHPILPNHLNNLGISYILRYQCLAQLADLDAAVEHLTQAVWLTPLGNSGILTRFNTLGLAYISRFEYLRELADLEKAIDYLGQTVSLAPKGHPDKARFHNNLSMSYRKRFQHLEELADMHKAIENSGLSVSLTADGHPDKPARIDNLGLSYQSRFDHLGELADLDRAIKYKTQAVSLTPEGHPDQSGFLNSLGTAYQRRFQQTGAREDLDAAVSHLKQAVSRTPQGHPGKPKWLTNLSEAYNARFRFFGHPDDLRSSINCVEHAAQTSTGPPWTRFEAARIWARLSNTYKLPASLTAYRQLITLIPQLVWLGSTTERRYELLASVGDVAIEAAAVAVRLQKFDLALEWLEQGRSIVWNQMFQLRTPLDQLFSIDAVLAEELKQVARELEHASSVNPSTLGPKSSQPTLEGAAQRHHRLAEKQERLVEKARLLPGMHDFLRPKGASSLVAAAHTGAVVLVNVHQSSCHALIIRPHATNVDCIALTSFTYEKASNARTNLARSLRAQGRDSRGVSNGPKVNDKHGMEKLLKMLWTDIAKPVLDFLGYIITTDTNECLPHITWCTTGPLSFLPLHAAGDYNTPDQLLFRYAISSFTPNLSALLTRPADPAAFSGILAISQASTPGFRPLPGTTAELDRVARQAGDSRLTRLDGREATCSTVLAAMDEHSWVHFACHASQNSVKPTASAFHLHDGPLDLASITRKQLKHADLAFLSACQTATGDKELSEEAVHLAAGMIMAGYRTVIATMWSIEDKDAPIVAEKFYAYMLNGEAPNQRKAAKALHYAMGYLRDRIGVKEFERWTPYVHLGV